MTERYVGSWAIARSIVDDDRAAAIACTGSATLRRHDGAVVYEEAVSYELAHKRIHATQTYRFTACNGAIVAAFSDGAPFFSLRLDSDGIGRALHQCGDDRYALTLNLREPDTWETRWDVSGAKRLHIISRYTRN
jgi:hypothetical protein